MFRSLSWRAAAAFLLLLVTLFLVLGFVLSDRARDSAEHDLVQRAFTEAKGLASAATVLPANGLTPGSLDAVERIALSTDSVGLVLLANGAPVYGTPPNGDPLTYRLPEFQGALAGQPTQTVRTDPATGTKLLYSAVPITRGGSVVAAARVSVPRDSVGAAQAATWRRLGIAFGIAAIIGGLLHLWLIAPVSRTVRSLGEVTKHLAGGQLYERAGEPAYSEADGLAAAINDMAASLEQQVTQSYRERDTFGAVIDGMTEGLLVIDEKGAVSLANPAAAKLFAPDGQPMNGKRLMEVVRDHEIARVANEALAQTRQKTVDVMFGRELRPLRVTVTPLKERSGISALLIVQDMTEIHRLENVRREFVANVSHELRTPLASIKAAADALERGAIDDKTLARDFLERINVEVDHVTGLVQSLLDLSRMETGRANFEMKSVDIRALAKETAERLLPQA
ncbi:MAG: PAS domain-containing protein [Chloroflexi bacterium]|nr:PAS domain-containing protein [Chloroflexota bacterium]